MTSQASQNGTMVASVPMPPAMAEIKQQSADEVLAELNRHPLFMTTLDETDGEGGDNPELEALRQLAYEGTKAEVMENFRQQGNDCARAKQWTDAREFYDKAIATMYAPPKEQEQKLDPGDEAMQIQVELDPEEEAKKEKDIAEACYVNRALCHLEKKNYGSCIRDCASTLRLNPSNVKAFYRSGVACLALDKIPEALNACTRGLQLESSNSSLKALLTKTTTRQKQVEEAAKIRREREERVASEKATVKLALKSRGILIRTTEKAPDLEDAEVKLEQVMDPSSALSFPVMLLYPMHAQSDFIKAFSEKDKLQDHLDYIFPLPWDEEKQYTVNGVEAYMETISGGLIKAGKKLPLGKILGSGKVEVVDGLINMNIVPKAKAGEWIDEFKRRRPS